jgi:hypothetical protein
MQHIPLPAGCEIYDGAPVFSAVDRSGSTTVIFCGLRAGRFGTHAFRQRPDGQVEWLDLGETTEKRSGVTLEPDGLYATWPDRSNRGVVRVGVPGFVPRGYDGPLPEQIEPIDVPSEVVDEGARQYTSAVKQEILGKLAALEAQIGTVGGGGGISRPEVEALAWEKGGDRVYAELGNPESGIVSRVRELVREMQPEQTAPVINKPEIRTIIRDELRSLLAEALNAVEE